jgi:regulatory protein
MSEDASSLKDYALGLLSQRSYTCAGIREKLEGRARKRRLSVESIPEIIERLVELRLLDDLKYCRMWVEERSRMRPRGKFMLDQELRKKGIPKDLLEQFWTDYGEIDEVALALRIYEKKRERVTGEPRKVREKLYRHLASKGFNHRVIQEVIASSAKDSPLDKAQIPY